MELFRSLFLTFAFPGPNADRPGYHADLCLVIDVSGSMQMPAVLKEMSFLSLKRAVATDRVSNFLDILVRTLNDGHVSCEGMDKSGLWRRDHNRLSRRAGSRICDSQHPGHCFLLHLVGRCF